MSQPNVLLRLLPALLVALSICLPVHAGPSRQGADRPEAAANLQTDVYILRGGAGIFSTGLVKLAAKLKQKGVASSVKSHAAWQTVVRTIATNQSKLGRRPVILIGHSLGADNAVRIAQALKKQGIRVDYIASFAATGPASVPANVRSVTNFYFKAGGWGAVFSADNNFRGRLNNVDMSGERGVNHFSIDDANALHDEVVRNVLRYVRPARSGMIQG